MTGDVSLARVEAVWDDPCIAVVRDMELDRVEGDRRVALLADAAEFFQAYLWESESCRAARETLAGRGLGEDVIRAFGVGYAPVGPSELRDHLSGLGYSIDELEAAGVAARSSRGRIHSHFRSRIMFPVRDADGRVHGFAGLGTHLGPSWPLWLTSPQTDIYDRSEAVFGLDRAAPEIAATGTVVFRADCIEVLLAHQEGVTNAVTVHSSGVTQQQLFTLSTGLEGGIDELDLQLPPGMRLEAPGGNGDGAQSAATAIRPTGDARTPASLPRFINLKRTFLVIATALLAVNAWTGAPLLALWIGSHAQGGKVLSTRGVLTVLVVLSVLVFGIGWVLTWLSAKYDELSGRPRLAGLTSPWHRAKRGDRVQDIRSRYGISAPEKVVAASVIVGILAFEAWFFFIAGSPFAN
jgi:DNA primase catalytic core, N-terminal domain